LIPSADEVLEDPATDYKSSGEMVLVNAPLITTPSPPTARTSFCASYRFAHDRVQQAAACLLSPKDTLETHIKLAEVSFLNILLIPSLDFF
jgi:hypothetical protein